jgi:two-component sensor histidine kinase
MQKDIPREQEAEQRVDAQRAADAGARDLARALEQKSTLLREVDHRVKNNLQLITSLLRLQARRATDPAVGLALMGAQERVNAVATVHRRLFRQSDGER